MSVIPSSGATGSQEERGTRPATWSAIRLTQAAGECTLRPVVGYWARAGVWAPGAVSWQQCGGGVVEAAGLPCPPRLEDHACTTPLPPAFTFLVIACTIPTSNFLRSWRLFCLRLCQGAPARYVCSKGQTVLGLSWLFDGRMAAQQQHGEPVTWVYQAVLTCQAMTWFHQSLTLPARAATAITRANSRITVRVSTLPLRPG